jgi:hypothetical protein
MTYRLRISVEMKDKTINGPMLNQIVGQALKGGNVQEIVVICRSVNRGALADKPKHESQHGITITFVEC